MLAILPHLQDPPQPALTHGPTCPRGSRGHARLQDHPTRPRGSRGSRLPLTIKPVLTTRATLDKHHT